MYRGYGEDDGPQRGDIWSWKMRGSRPHGLVVSDNGAWLKVEGRHRVWVLDAATGEVVFAFPTSDDLSTELSSDSRKAKDHVVRTSRLFQAYEEAALERLRSVLGPDATVADMGGPSSDWRLLGDRLLLPRNIGQGPGYQPFYYVFDLASAGVDGSPLFRTPANRDCRNAARVAWETTPPR